MCCGGCYVDHKKDYYPLVEKYDGGGLWGGIRDNIQEGKERIQLVNSFQVLLTGM